MSELKPVYNMTQEQNLFLAKRNIVDYIWKSANLEGIKVTYSDTQSIYNGMAVSGYTIDEINAINDLKHAWHFVLENINKPLDLDYIKKVHMLLGKFSVLNAGAIRREEVHIGGTDWIPDMPDDEKIINELDSLTENIATAPLETALDIMLFLMRSQRLLDGNKRLGMLIGNKIMIEHGQGIISVRQSDSSEFYLKLIRFYETNDSAEIKQFLYTNCIDGMDFAE